MTVHLDPGSCVCPTHGIDLTAQVVAQLEEQGTRAAMAPLGRRLPFAVAATCPGIDGNSEHAPICRGQYWVPRDHPHLPSIALTPGREVSSR